MAVTHDQTLIGDGTSAMPLGIAPGGVTTGDLATGAVTAAKIAPGQVVKSLNGLFDNVSLAAGPNITIVPSGNMLTVAAPNSLTAVADDSTLSGNGTMSSPLGINATTVPSTIVFFSNQNLSSGTLNNPGQDVLSKTVPAGSYLISASVNLFNNDSDQQLSTCSLSTGAFATIVIPHCCNDFRQLYIQDAATFSSQTTIKVHCSGFNIQANVEGISALTAIRAASIQ